MQSGSLYKLHSISGMLRGVHRPFSLISMILCGMVRSYALQGFSMSFHAQWDAVLPTLHAQFHHKHPYRPFPLVSIALCGVVSPYAPKGLHASFQSQWDAVLRLPYFQSRLKQPNRRDPALVLRY